jgi:hypothetical protein
MTQSHCGEKDKGEGVCGIPTFVALFRQKSIFLDARFRGHDESIPINSGGMENGKALG